MFTWIKKTAKAIVKAVAKKAAMIFGGSVAGATVASNAYAAFTVPELPVTNMETAGAAVAGLVAGYVLIKIVIRMIKGA